MIKKYPYIKKCINCSTDFVVKSAHYKAKKFCTFSCSSIYKTKHHRETNCLQCGTKLNRHQRKFCSKSCSATLNNQVYIKRKVTVTRTCLFCQNISKSNKHKYCSSTCLNQHRSQLVQERYNNNKIKKITIKSSTYNLTCKHCNKIFTEQRQIKYCNDCSHLYSHNGRARYWFSINVFKYPNLFDLDSLKKVGFRSKDNPNGYTRDHKVSVNEAIRNNYDPYYITHVMNCELMLWAENNKKNTKSSISYDDLVKLVDEYDRKNGRGG